MRIRIEGHNLPGRRWCSDGEWLENVHVAVQDGKDPSGLVAGDGSFRMFRRAKLMLNTVDPGLMRRVSADGTVLLARIDLTDGCGGPRCARVNPPHLVWTLG